MGRSKQQAMMFLLGATLFGGMLGFSAERVFGHRPTRGWAQRTTMYDDIGLSEKQRASMDSLLDDSNCQIDKVMKPVRPMLDSIHTEARHRMRALMTPQQQAKLDNRIRADSIRRASRSGPRPQRQDACKK
jgi:Spy/CpxP family protein refolding chaperone